MGSVHVRGVRVCLCFCCVSVCVCALCVSIVTHPATPNTSPDRVERITEQLAAKDRHSIADMKRMQADLVSAHARRYINVLRLQLDRSDAHERLLADWDLRYTAESKAGAEFRFVCVSCVSVCAHFLPTQPPFSRNSTSSSSSKSSAASPVPKRQRISQPNLRSFSCLISLIDWC